MILVSSSLENTLEISEGYVYAMEIATPRLFARIVQTFIQLGNGEETLEDFRITDGYKVLAAEKLLWVIADPCQADLNTKKILTRLYARVDAYFSSDEDKRREFIRQIYGLTQLLDTILSQINTETIYKDEPDVQSFCKFIELKIACDNNQEIPARIMHMLDILSEWQPETMLVLCNLKAYYDDGMLSELYKYG